MYLAVVVIPCRMHFVMLDEFVLMNLERRRCLSGGMRSSQ